MEDRFQFRIYDKKLKRMVEGVTNLNPLLLDKRFNDDADKYVIMQCIGIKDTKDKLIFEGDIVKDVLNSTFVVEHSKDYSTTLLKRNEGSMVFYPNLKLEIIGNIYENPELLEGNNVIS